MEEMDFLKVKVNSILVLNISLDGEIGVFSDDKFIFNSYMTYIMPTSKLIIKSKALKRKKLLIKLTQVKQSLQLDDVQRSCQKKGLLTIRG